MFRFGWRLLVALIVEEWIRRYEEKRADGRIVIHVYVNAEWALEELDRLALVAESLDSDVSEIGVSLLKDTVPASLPGDEHE